MIKSLCVARMNFWKNAEQLLLELKKGHEGRGSESLGPFTEDGSFKGGFVLLSGRKAWEGHSFQLGQMKS